VRRSRSTAPTAVLAGGLMTMGVLHGVAPQPFDTIVPPWLPGTARFWTCASGVAELAVGAAVAASRTRRLGALAAAALFVAVFPANLQQTVTAFRSERTSRAYRAATVARLPMQVPLVVQAIRIARRRAAAAEGTR
jgi:uncharacterized membrane protein